MSEGEIEVLRLAAEGMSGPDRRDSLKIGRTGDHACAAARRCSVHGDRLLMRLSALNDLSGLANAPKVAEAVLDLLPDSGMIVIDRGLRIVLMRGPVYERHGYDVASAVGRDLHDVIPAAAWVRLGEHWLAALAGESCTVDTESVDGEGDYWLHFAPLRSKAGAVGAIMIAQDITERVRVREQIDHRLIQQAAVSTLGSLALEGRPLVELFDEAARVLHETLASDVIMVLETTADGGISVRASAGEVAPAPPEPSPDLQRSIGHMREAGETLLTSDLSSETQFQAPGLEAEGMLSLLAAPIGAGTTAFGELVACSRDRAAFSGDDLAFVESIANVLMAAVERERSVVESHKEQTLAARREEQLNDAQRLARMGSWDTDFASRTHQLSENMRELLALDSCLTTDEVFLARVHPDDRARMASVMTTRPDDDATAEFRVRLPNGRVRELSSVFHSIRDAAGVAKGLRGTVKDVTEARASEAALRRSEERFRQGFDNAPIAMSLVDPASMRDLRVNDSFCTMVGRTRDALYGLTFAEISHDDDQPDITENMPRLVSGELDQFVTEKRYPRPDGTEAWASVSITPVREPDGSVDVLFGQMVDITDRKAREASLKAQLDEIAGLGEIRRAFEEDRFELHAQPIIDLATGETVQRELLIRMRSRDGKLIPPGDFLPAAEKHGAIRDIDRWVIAQGAELAARGIDVEINISAASIGDPGLISDIEHELERTGAAPSRLVFEITETALVEKTEVAVVLAERLRKLGCRFALDDFGSGYGGFHYLKHLPMDFLKIDREFIRDARTSEGDQHVIRAIIGLAKGFGLQTIAEGVEDQETLDMLKEFGVDHVQGFHVGRPAPLLSPAA
jgi:PAS domain S-box-containing protein